jgi:hypothetical protein
MDIDSLGNFIVAAKAACYVGGATAGASSRQGSHDIGWSDGPWLYLDSYFGGTDFAGQEVVWFDGKPIWAMNYYGTVTDGRLIDAERAGAVIKAALAALYREGRFLGGFCYQHAFGTYRDESSGETDRFTGRECIEVDGVESYQLWYHGGLITV